MVSLRIPSRALDLTTQLPKHKCKRQYTGAGASNAGTAVRKPATTIWPHLVSTTSRVQANIQLIGTSNALIAVPQLLLASLASAVRSFNHFQFIHQFHLLANHYPFPYTPFSPAL